MLYRVYISGWEVPEKQIQRLLKKYYGIRVRIGEGLADRKETELSVNLSPYSEECKAEKLLDEINRKICNLEPKRSSDFLLKLRGSIVVLPLEEVDFIKKEKGRVIFYGREKISSAHMSMRELEEALPMFFLRSHSSYLVNVYRVRKFAESELMMMNGERIPVSRSCQDRVHKMALYFRKSI